MSTNKWSAGTKSRTKTGTDVEGRARAEIETAFGRWLKQKRKALDLTQAELAQRVGIAPATLEKIEQSRRRPSKQVAQALAAGLELDAAERATFLLLARGVYPPEQPPLRQPARRLNNLPAPLTPLIDRRREVAQVREYLDRPAVRLVTLTGAPGVGKTRLAIQVANELLPGFADGVWFVRLSPIHDPFLVVPTIARVLGITGIGAQPILERMKTALRDKQLLFVLDNFEQVVVAGPEISELLLACPALKVLCTSRIQLHLYGEYEYPVAPLAVPKRGGVLDPQSLMEYDAIRLFVLRGQAFKPEFALDESNAKSILDISRALDGLPLAIELAAARLRMYTPHALAKQLTGTITDRLPLLSGGPRDLAARQQTVSEAIAWSYNLLPEPDQKLFRELSVFVGGGTIDAILAICQGSTHDRVVFLSEHNLLRAEPGSTGEMRYSMLELIRAFASDRLIKSSKAGEAQRRHADFFLALAQADHGSAAWFERMEAERDNERASLRYFLDHHAGEPALELCIQLRWFWEAKGYQLEGRRWMREALVMRKRVPIELQVRALEGYSTFSWQLGDYAQAQVHAQEGLDLSRQNARHDLEASMLLLMGRINLEQGNYSGAQVSLEECLELVREQENPSGLGGVLMHLGELALNEGDLERAGRYFRESLEYGTRSHVTLWVSMALNGLGWVALARRDYIQACSCFKDSSRWAIEARLIRPATLALAGLASAVGTSAEAKADVLHRAASLWGAAQALREESGLPFSTGDALRIANYMTTASSRLGARAWETAVAEGRGLTLEQAAALAMTAEV